MKSPEDNKIDDSNANQKHQSSNTRKNKEQSVSYVRDISKINEEIENIKKKTNTDKMKLRKSTETKIFQSNSLIQMQKQNEMPQNHIQQMSSKDHHHVDAER